MHPFNWPQSHKPGPQQWQLWQQALIRMLNLGQAQQLPLPLGKWWWQTREKNGWFTNEDGTQLYQQLSQDWFTFTPLPHRRHTWSFSSAAESISAEWLPEHLHKATVYCHNQLITVTGHGLIEDTLPVMGMH